MPSLINLRIGGGGPLIYRWDDEGRLSRPGPVRPTCRLIRLRLKGGKFTMKVLRHLIAATAALLAVASVAPTVAHAQIGVEINVTVPPPARRVEVQYPSPGAEYVWHRGDWVYNPERGEYLWHPGRWVPRPDAEHTVWFPGDWVNFQGAWRYVPGHWRTPAEGPPPDYIKLVDVIKEPPTLQSEATPAPVAGYA